MEGTDPSAVHFYWGPADKDGHPTAWVRSAEQPGVGQTGGQSREWLWTTGGGLAVREPAGSLRLFVFFFRVAHNPQGKGVWGFTVVGTALGVIDNAGEAADRWNVRLVNLPKSLVSLSSKANGVKNAPDDAELTWGMAACVDPDSRGRNSPDALIYGVRRSVVGNMGLVLAQGAHREHRPVRHLEVLCGQEFLVTDAGCCRNPRQRCGARVLGRASR